METGPPCVEYLGRDQQHTASTVRKINVHKIILPDNFGKYIYIYIYITLHKDSSSCAWGKNLWHQRDGKEAQTGD